MSFRSDRNAELTQLNINFLTSLNKQQSYSLATIYPYVTQPNGETGMQFDFFYKIPKNSLLGGKYGTELNVNFSNCYTLHKKQIQLTQTQLELAGHMVMNQNFSNLVMKKYFKN